ELNHNIYVTAKTKAEKDKAYNDTVDLLEENVAKGVMTAEKAAQYRNNMRKEWSLDEAYYDARNNKELYDYKRDNGLYKDLYEDDLAKVETYATNLHKKTMDEYKIGIAKAQINTAIDLLDKIDKGKATLEEIDRAQVLGEIKSPDGIDSNVANSFRKMLSTRKQNPDIRLSEYAKLSAESDIFFKEDGSVKTEDVDTSLKKLKVYRDKVLQSAGEGKLNEPDAKQLLEDVGIAANILATQKAESNVETEKRKARKWMWGWKSKYSKDIDVERGRLLQEFNSAINDGKSVAEAQAIAVDRLNIALNDNRTKYIIDNNYKFPKGILRVTGYDDYGDPIFERAK
ncbi:MAG: hypothetical protein M0P69_12235, partial [Bacteroidales bacterium]|nr:hypothetical protein [Bacteroidales bacterium]